MKSYRAVARERPWSRRSSIAASRPLDATLAIYSLYFSRVSISTSRILTLFLGLTVYPLIVNGSWSTLRALGTKCIITVLSALKVTPLLLS